MRWSDVLPGILVHHDQLGIGKISRKLEENDPELGVHVNFLFYAPEIKVRLDVLKLVDGSNVRVTYSIVDIESVKPENYSQDSINLSKEDVVIWSTKPVEWFAPAGVQRGKLNIIKKVLPK